MPAFAAFIVVALIVVGAVMFWREVSLSVGPVNVRVTNESDLYLTVEVCEVAEGDGAVLAEWGGQALDPGQTLVVSRGAGGDSRLQVRVTDINGRVRRYTLLQYLRNSGPGTFRLRLAADGLVAAKVRMNREDEFRDIRWVAD